MKIKQRKIIWESLEQKSHLLSIFMSNGLFLFEHFAGISGLSLFGTNVLKLLEKMFYI